MSSTIVAAADGSSLGNPGPAGWCWYIDADCWQAGGWPNSTNNRGELEAVAALLEATQVDASAQLRILCDSQYVINSVTKWMPGWKRKGWKKSDGKPVLNVDILQRIDALLAGRNVSFEWVKGHAGHEMNEAADVRARAVATAIQRGQEPDRGPGYKGARGGSDIRGADDDSVRVTAVPSLSFEAPELALTEAEETPEARLRSAHATLVRAHQKNQKRFAFLTKNAVQVPGGVPADYAAARHEFYVQANTGLVVSSAADGTWVCSTTWDLSHQGAGLAELLSIHTVS